MSRLYSVIPSEKVEDAAKNLVESTFEQNGIPASMCLGHVHFFMISGGPSLTTNFITDAYMTRQNLERIKKDLNEWLDREIDRVDQQGWGTSD